MARHIFQLTHESEQLHNHVLDAKDRVLLVDTLGALIIRMIDKYVRGAKAHSIPLIDRVVFDDLHDELIDALFYHHALKLKLQQTTL